MELQDYMGQVVAHFIPFGDYVDLDARQEHGLRRTHHWLRNESGATDGTPW